MTPQTTFANGVHPLNIGRHLKGLKPLYEEGIGWKGKPARVARPEDLKSSWGAMMTVLATAKGGALKTAPPEPATTGLNAAIWEAIRATPGMTSVDIGTALNLSTSNCYHRGNGYRTSDSICSSISYCSAALRLFHPSYEYSKITS